MVVVRVRDDHGVEVAGLEGEAAVGAVRVEAVRIKQPAVQQDSAVFDLQQMGASRDLTGGPMKRNANVHPPARAFDRGLDPREPLHIPCKRLAGPATSDPGFIGPASLVGPVEQSRSRGFPLVFADSMMP